MPPARLARARPRRPTLRRPGRDPGARPRRHVAPRARPRRHRAHRADRPPDHTALLVVEVAFSSLRTDTTIKPALYAAGGIPELWVVDIPARALRVLREPVAGGYARQWRSAPPETVAPTALDIEPLDLSELYAGL